jgi:hypothetical protein
LSAVAQAGGDISTFEHTDDRPAIQPARLIAIGALIAALLGLAAVLATSFALSGVGSRAAVGHSRSASARMAQASLPSTFAESPSFTLPFPPNRADRPTRRGEVPSLYADGLACSTGCRPYDAETGWPLAPFHRPHPIRAGLNELRPESLHVAIDIQARDGARVYAVQPGVAQVLTPSGPDARIQVGNYIYWHINPKVQTGDVVIPFKTVVGKVMAGYGHMAFSEIGADGQYANPLRPEGTVLEPYADHAVPVIGKPSVSANGQVVAPAYDPQTFIRKTTYFTPVLAPAAIAYRLYDRHGAPVTPLEWAFRGTHLLQFSQRSLIYAPGVHDPGYNCFATRSVCIPHWTYRVADGLAPPLPTGLDPGRYRLTIYAWDWADNETALDTTVALSAGGWKPIGHVPASLSRIPGYFDRNLLLPPAPPARQPLPPGGYRSPSQPLAPSPTGTGPPTGANPPTAVRPPAATNQELPPTGQRSPGTSSEQSPGTTSQQGPGTSGQQSPGTSSPPAPPTGGQAPTGSPR